MRLLYVIDSLESGGAERSLVGMVPHLARGGIDLHLAHFGTGEGLAPAARSGGAKVTQLASRSRRDRVLQLRSLIGELRPDLVHTTLFESDIAGRISARSCGVPVVSSLVGVPYGPEHLADRELKRSKVRLAQAADALTVRLVRRFHAVSATVARTMTRRLGIPAGRVDVVLRGRDALVMGRRSQERRESVRHRLGFSDGAPLILAVARHEHAKGLDLLIRGMSEVLADIPTARLLVAGASGGSSDALQRLRGDLGLEAVVDFLGPRDDVYDLLATSDAFVLPSRREGLPGAVLEAMALEAPIVATDLEAVRELVTTHMAVLTPTEDPAALAGAVIGVLRDPATAAARSAAARRRFESSLTIEQSAAGMVAFYERALS